MDYFDRQGNPMTQEQYIAAYSGDFESTRRVAKTEFPGDVMVSTVWLALDHSFGVGPPLIFETMIFGGDHSGLQWRYATEEEAAAGHERVVEALRDGRDPDEVSG